MPQFVLTLPEQGQPLGHLSTFAGVSDLDLSGDIVWAINVGGNDTITVGGVMFLSDAEAIAAGATIESSRRKAAWGERPEYGDDADNDQLESIMHSIRSSTFGLGIGHVAVRLPLEPGDYHIQLLFSENFYNGTTPVPEVGISFLVKRTFPIEVEGERVAEELLLPDAHGRRNLGDAPRQGVVCSHAVAVLDLTLDVVLPTRPHIETGESHTSFDRTPILNAIIVTSVVSDD